MTLETTYIFRGLSRRTSTILVSFWFFLSPAVAQTGSEGIENGAYQYQGSFELGYRFVNSLGSQSVYDTFVNQHQGPRVLDETLSARSLNHEGSLFDNLFVSSFGWGGDPENAARMRMSKNRAYDFNMSFRRDHNVFDYNLLANPLNPGNAYVQSVKLNGASLSTPIVHHADFKAGGSLSFVMGPAPSKWGQGS